jgi:hypothetical protein
MDAIVVFAINTSEAISIDCIFDEISKAFCDHDIDRL